MSERVGRFRVNEIYCGDALALIKDLPDGSVDLIITDPPFGIEFRAGRKNYNRKEDRVLEGYNEIPKDRYYDFTLAWMQEAKRVLRRTGSMYVFSGWTNLRDVLNAIHEVGLITINHIIWKYQFGVFTRRKFVTSHYHILFLVKDKKKYKFNKIEHYPEDVWVINREYWRGKTKPPTKLPLGLVKKMVLYSSDPGDLVFDPFLGSGTVAVAAKALGRRYLGFEIVPEYWELAKRRLSETRPEAPGPSLL